MFKQRPWVWFILGWVLFLGMTALTLVIAQQHKPGTVSVETTPQR